MTVAPEYYLGVDVGGTKTHAVLLDGTAGIVAESRLPSVPGPTGVVDTVLAAADQCRAQLGVELSQLGSVGVGIPGQVDPATGVVRTAVNLAITTLPLGELLSERLQTSVVVDNDVKVAALGVRAELGLADGDLSYLNFGTGVASATIIHGRLVRGVSNAAGEIGHLAIDPAGELCECGQYGCLETLAGGSYINARLAAAGLTLVGLFAAAENGSPQAQHQADLIVNGITSAIQIMVLAHGSPRVVLNGGVIHHCPGLFDAVRGRLESIANSSAFIASLGLADRLVIAPSGRPIAALGAALVGYGSDDSPRAAGRFATVPGL